VTGYTISFSFKIIFPTSAGEIIGGCDFFVSSFFNRFYFLLLQELKATMAMANTINFFIF
jgi:hypothetical protein